MRFREAVRNGCKQLSAIYPEGEASAILTWVIEHITGTGREELTREDPLLSPEHIDRLHNIMPRLFQSEPVQYILHESWFCGLPFYVDHNVLIPRPETEELVEWIISNCKFPIDTLNILDVGTGSGCIAIALKRRMRKTTVWGCDISAAALEVAKGNAMQLGTEVNFVQLDFLSNEERSSLPPFDLVVSNPPYIPVSDRLSMDANVRDHEPATALFVADDDPLIFYRVLASFGKEKLNASGTLYMEIHEDMGNEIMALLEEQGYYPELKKDMQGKDRMVRARLQP